MASGQSRSSALLVAALVVMTSGWAATAGRGPTPSPAARPAGPLPIVAEHRYRMAAKIRPLLFWIRRDNVGGARVVWRQSDNGAVAFELLIGSDPARAPRRINRWGYIAEETRGSETRLLGVMKQSDEKSIKEAEATLARDAQAARYVFKIIRGTATADEASAGVTTIHVTRDLTYRDVGILLDLVSDETETTAVRQVRLPSGTRPGFLVALADLIHRSLEARSAAAVPPRTGNGVAYIYNGTLHDLTLRKIEFLRAVRVGDRRYTDAARGEFESRNRATDDKTRFELTYGTRDPFAGIPLHVSYQPRWWFEIELLLDAGVTF